MRNLRWFDVDIEYFCLPRRILEAVWFMSMSCWCTAGLTCSIMLDMSHYCAVMRSHSREWARSSCDYKNSVFRFFFSRGIRFHTFFNPSISKKMNQNWAICCVFFPLSYAMSPKTSGAFCRWLLICIKRKTLARVIGCILPVASYLYQTKNIGPWHWVHFDGGFLFVKAWAKSTHRMHTKYDHL